MAEPLSSRDLSAFVAAVETGSVQGAAEALDLTQSATTKRIQSLEARLGVSLLVRSRKGVRPTEEGKALYPEASRGLNVLALAERLVGASKESQPLRIAASHTVGGCLLSSWLAEFRPSAPDLQPQVDVLNSPAVLEALRDGDADVGFVEGLDLLTGFEAKAIGKDEIVLAVAAGHRWARRRSVLPPELVEERYISREAGSGTRAVADAYLAAAGLRLEPDLTMASVEAVKRSLATGGFALISQLALDPEISAGRIVAVPVKDLKIERTLTAVRLAEARRREPGQRFWNWLEAGASAKPGSDCV